MKRLRALVLLVMVGAACGPRSSGPSGPTATLRAYADALSNGKADVAYDLLSDDAKRSVSREAFRRLVIENPADTKTSRRRSPAQAVPLW